MLSYGQNQSVTPLLVVAILRWKNIEAPYCHQHATEFRRRFTRIQILLYVMFLTGCGLLFLAPNWLACFDKAGHEPTLFGKLLIGTAIALGIGCVVIMSFVKPRLFDMRIDDAKNDVVISAKSEAFIAAIEPAHDGK